MKDTNVNGISYNTRYVTSLSWPEFKIEFEADEKQLKYIYTLCHETAGLKPDFKKALNQTTDGGE